MIEYLKYFVIGSSSLVYILHFIIINLKNYSDNFKKIYSIIAPTYYGLMAMLAKWISKNYNIKIQKSLLITSLISISVVFSLNYFFSSKIFEPYISFTCKNWIQYLINMGLRHLFAYNVVIYQLVKNFSYYPVKIFVIGSSILAFFIAFIGNIMFLFKKNISTFSFSQFMILEPIMQGLGLLLYMSIFHYYLGYSLYNSILIWISFGSLVWLFWAYNLKLYNYKNIQWLYGYLIVTLLRTIKGIILYYLLKNLK